MTSLPPIVAETEALLRQLADEFTHPRDGECLCCYVARQLNEFACDGSHRHAFRYRDAMAPRATALAARLRDVGACCCDCELFLNGYELRGQPQDTRYDEDVFDDEPAEPAPEPLPDCVGVRRGSVRPCGNWVRIRRR